MGTSSRNGFLLDGATHLLPTHYLTQPLSVLDIVPGNSPEMHVTKWDTGNVDNR